MPFVDDPNKAIKVTLAQVSKSGFLGLGYRDPKLLVQFPDQSRPRSLTSFDVPTWKIPDIWIRSPIGGAPAEEHPARVDESGRHHAMVTCDLAVDHSCQSHTSRWRASGERGTPLPRLIP